MENILECRGLVKLFSELLGAQQRGPDRAKGPDRWPVGAERQREEHLPEMRLPRAETDNGKNLFQWKKIR